MHASLSFWKRTVAAALAIGALTTASSLAQVNTGTPQAGATTAGNATAGTATTGGTTSTSTGGTAGTTGSAAGTATVAGRPILQTSGEPAIVGQTLGLSFAGVAGSPLTIGAIADTSPLSRLGLQTGDQILGVNGHPAGNGIGLLNELSRLGNGNQPASLTVMTASGTRQILNVPTSALQQIAQARQPTGAGGTGNTGGTTLNGVGARSGIGVPASAARGEAQNFVTQVMGVTITPTATGLVVSNIASDSPLQGLGLQVGDQITGVNSSSLASPTDVLNRLVGAAQNGANASATLNILRNGAPLTLTVPSANLQALAQTRAQFTPVRGPLSPQSSRSGAGSTTPTNRAAATAQTTDTGATGTGTGGVPINPFVQEALDTQAAANASGESAALARGAQPGLTASQPATLSGATVPAGSTPTVQQALETQATANQTDTSGTRMLSRGAAGTGAAVSGAGSAGTTPATPDQQAAVNALSGFQAPATGTATQAGATANANSTEDASLPKTVITPNGPKIMLPGQAQAQGRGGAGGVMPPNAKGVPGGGKAEGKAGAGAHGNGAHGNGGARQSGGGGGGGGAAKAGAS